MKLLAYLSLLSCLSLAACAKTRDPGHAFKTGTTAGTSSSPGSQGTGGDITITGLTTGTTSETTTTDCAPSLKGTIRDHSPDRNPDFEYVIADDRAIVQSVLGVDGKPVYGGNPITPTTHGKATFDQWYRDTPGINIGIPLEIPLTAGQDGVYTYDNQAFFPIDGQGWGDEGRPHNYHFTFEVHTQFVYRGGEVFTFIGDDDLYTFINGKLALNLGGVHEAEMASVDLDASAKDLGISVGNVYRLDFFFAERHTVDSHFRVDTTIACFTPASDIQ